ncbi:2-dehydro-3-deoxy-6-phosphogalactonate aldolase [Aurantimonas sp. A2-1-M11]|uniref:2-dehydro-3-deoxy-6-phosphogalactonate aldolase n=1 Tax=Aurantimonas sp. A2-1-M11 TaxID=3113712 RepID=UPI002F93C3CE
MTDLRSAPWPKLTRDLVAILRGLPPEDCEAVVGALLEAGFEAIEIPLNSPDPFHSIAAAARMAPEGVLIGAGTVLTPDDTDRLHAAGGRLLVSPNVDAAVLQRAAVHGMVTMPGVLTPTEALAAAAAGASALKFFPASVLGPNGIKAIGTVLPKDLPVGAVGGVSEADFAAYGAIGIRHFGLGSSLYKPGDDAATVRARADKAVAAYDAAFPSAG